ncbi:MAG TPA: Calx-beta domain-containing protein [Thermoanaerobaculia bacterium]|nr:Calx-beta domain-containing protein [Thermoanaerobaculia bacterium]
MRSRPARAAVYLALATTCGLLEGMAFAPVAAQGPVEPTITVHVDDTEASAGDEVSIFLRTYAPRPLGQGQLCIVVRRPERRRARSLAPAHHAADVADVTTEDDAPFAAFLGGEVFSETGDAVADFLLRTEGADQELRIDFASPSATINVDDLAPLARLDFRLRDDLVIGDTFVLELDLERSIALDPGGLTVPLGSAPGSLFVVEAGTRGGAGLLRFEQRTYHATESSGVAVITVERVRGSDGEVSVDFTTSPGTATPGDDYLDQDGVLSWASGELGSRTVLIPVLADDRIEDTETVRIALGAVSGGARLDPERSTAVLAIHDVPPRPLPRRGAIRVASPRYQAVEAAGELVVEVERFGGDDGAVSVDYATADLSAEAGTDYEPASGSLHWADGESGPKDIRIVLLDDDLDEGLETAELRLLRARGGAQLDLGGRVARLEILDDDAPDTSCVPGPFVGCLQAGRFQVRARWRASDARGSATDAPGRAPDAAGRAWAETVSDSAGWFWFFSPDNAELLFKILDACALPEAPGFWVSIAAATPLEYTVFVTDVLTGVSKEYAGSAAQPPAPVLDTETFRDCR